MKRYPDGTVTAQYECREGMNTVSTAPAVCVGDTGENEDWDIPFLICARELTCLFGFCVCLLLLFSGYFFVGLGFLLLL